MGVCNIRLGSMLSFDEEQEKDIIDVINNLNSRHKMGQFVSSLIRIALENPEMLNYKDGRYENGAILNQMEKLGISYDRAVFFNKVTKEVNDMKNKVDKMYDMVMNMYILSQMGKHLGLEEKSENMLTANFLLEKQVKELQDTLGVGLNSSLFASNKTEDTKKRAEDALEYILNTYDGIVTELNKRFEVQKIELPAITVGQPSGEVGQSGAIGNVVVGQQNMQSGQQSGAVATTQTVDDTKADKLEDLLNLNKEEDEYIDFGDADLGALDNFFGM